MRTIIRLVSGKGKRTRLKFGVENLTIYDALEFAKEESIDGVLVVIKDREAGVVAENGERNALYDG
jgi:hypothetical protein